MTTQAGASVHEGRIPGQRRAGRAWILVGVAVLGISLAAPIGAATAAPALAVAFWRSAAGAAATVPLVVLAERRQRQALGRQTWRGCLAAGALLAVHFALWLPSLRLTTVTAATALVATTPMWTVVLARLRGEAVPGATWGGVGLALLGVVIMTGIDAGRGGRQLLGDVLALAAGIAAAGYVQVGEGVRRTTPTVVYTAVAYATCAVLLLPLCLVSGAALAGWGPRTWVELGVLTVAAQLLGHSLLNAALPAVGVTPLSLSILLEVPGAALVAWAWLGASPPWTVVPAVLLLLGGLVLVIRSRAGRIPVDPVDELAA